MSGSTPRSGWPPRTAGGSGLGQPRRPRFRGRRARPGRDDDGYRQRSARLGLWARQGGGDRRERTPRCAGSRSSRGMTLPRTGGGRGEGLVTGASGPTHEGPRANWRTKSRLRTGRSGPVRPVPGAAEACRECFWWPRDVLDRAGRGTAVQLSDPTPACRSLAAGQPNPPDGRAPADRTCQAGRLPGARTREMLRTCQVRGLAKWVAANRPGVPNGARSHVSGSAKQSRAAR